jgi:hypothetical protein
MVAGLISPDKLSVMNRRSVLLLALWLAVMLFPLAGFFSLFPGGRDWFHARTSSEALHIVAHLLIFWGWVLLLAFVSQSRFNLWNVLRMYGVALLVGFAQEGIQALAARYAGFTGAEFFDIGIDMLGASLGVLAWGLLRSRIAGTD